MKANTLNKKERLKSITVIDAVFKQGNSIKNGPIVLIWRETSFEDKVALKVGFSVPKRLFKKAVDRNKIKRLLREAYRLNNHELKDGLLKQDKQLALFLVYRGNTMPNYKALSDKIILTLQRLVEDLNSDIKA